MFTITEIRLSLTLDKDHRISLACGTHRLHVFIYLIPSTSFMSKASRITESSIIKHFAIVKHMEESKMYLLSKVVKGRPGVIN